MSRTVRRTADVTPSDSVRLPEPTAGLYIGDIGGGTDLKVLFAGDDPADPRTFTGLAAGQELRGFDVVKVFATGTTVAAIVAYLQPEA